MVVLCWLGPALEVAEPVAEFRRLESRGEAASGRSECAEHGVGTEAPLGEAPASLGQRVPATPSHGGPTQVTREAGACTVNLEHMYMCALHVLSCLCCDELLRLTTSN